MAIIDRVEKRIGEFDDREKIEELATTICDRLLLRAGVAAFDENGNRKTFPPLLESVAVDAICKAYNQLGYEGISAEGVDTINTTFIANILDEYQSEIQAYQEIQQKENPDIAGIIRFL